MKLSLGVYGATGCWKNKLPSLALLQRKAKLLKCNKILRSVIYFKCSLCCSSLDVNVWDSSAAAGGTGTASLAGAGMCRFPAAEEEHSPAVGMGFFISIQEKLIPISSYK